MDITKSQSDFEDWWNAPEQAELRNSCAMWWGFRIWKAGRESIEVVIPPFDGYKDHVAKELQEALKIALRTAGIRIKGESDGTK
ncbi:hypothetical protein [Yersinia enterocolitica]|uniref:hypothetical protein n=1 Tax=Yersinia enterocolitica TaxID=630 RepID=UPI000683702E|nr:hypothetical protein [Yersinia enterocolitica]